MEDKIRQFILGQFGDSVIREDDFRGELSFYIKPEALAPLCQALKEEPELQVDHLKDITAIDWLGGAEGERGRFEIVYNLYSLKHSFRFFLKVFLPDDAPRIASLTSLWNGADWLEREVWDMFGIEFEGHPNLTRILTPDDFDGYPLRMDFPLTYEVPQFSWNKDDPPEVLK